MLARLIAASLLLLPPPAAAQIPHLAHGQLIVDGKPFLIRGGELGNSSASSREWLAPYWPRLKAMHLNTVLAPVSWELVEPEEGRFDWSSIDWLLTDARANGMHLVLLWFGSWKNSMSTYAPSWVKRDTARFPRAIAADGTPQNILSVFSEATLAADSGAFSALMRHLRAADPQGTVLMVQVENEIGFLPDAREHGAADVAFAKPAPMGLSREPIGQYQYPTWADLFGAGSPAEEAFTAWNYAAYVEAVAAAGKRAYPLPMYVNGAQPRPGAQPGEYPSGGPLAHLAAIWKRGAPSIDFIAPDIYFPNFGEILAGYAIPGNPIFVPEANNAGEPHAAANAMLAIGRYGAFGFSPFAIESIDEPGATQLGSFYAMLEQLAPEILAAQSQRRIMGFAPTATFAGAVDESSQQAVLGGYRFSVSFVDPWTTRDKQVPAEHGGMVLWLGGEDFLVAGSGVTLTIQPADGKGQAGLDHVEEGGFVDGKWLAGRRLNGDQTHQGRHIRLPPNAFGIQKVRLYRYS